jgi:hypothetical protein
MVAVATLALMSAVSAKAATYTIVINDPSQGIAETDTLSTSFTPHQGWSQGPLQSWGFGENNIATGGWLDFYNNNDSYGSNYPLGEFFTKEGGSAGNVAFTTTSPFYTLTGFGSTYQLSISEGNGWSKPTIYGLTDGGTVTITAVPEPATWAMLILGLGMIGFVARRRSEGVAQTA